MRTMIEHKDDSPAFEKILHNRRNRPNAKPRHKRPWRQRINQQVFVVSAL